MSILTCFLRRRGFELRDLTRNVPKVRRYVGNEGSYHYVSLPTLLYPGYHAELKIYKNKTLRDLVSIRVTCQPYRYAELSAQRAAYREFWSTIVNDIKVLRSSELFIRMFGFFITFPSARFSVRKLDIGGVG